MLANCTLSTDGVMTMNKPKGKDLLELLISLYAEQEGVKIKYELEGVGEWAR